MARRTLIDEEKYAILFRALRDKHNEPVMPAIKRALKLAGFSDAHIDYYRRTGRHLDEVPADEWSEFDRDFREMEKDFEEMGSEFSNMRETTSSFESDIDRSKFRMRKRIRQILMIGILFLTVSWAIVFGLLIIGNDDDSKSSDLPAMTETTPVEDGDKL